MTRNGIQYANGKPVESESPDGTPTTRLAEAFGWAGLIIGDAETDADLDAWAEWALSEPELLCVGSGGLAAALARCLPADDPAPPLPQVERVVVAAGSAHPQTHAQTDALATIWGSRTGRILL